MKKFLSILLAVMMVLSTVSFAAPSIAGVADTAVEMPLDALYAPEEEAAVLAAELPKDTSTYGEMIFELNFDNLSSISSQTIMFADAGWINPEFTYTYQYMVEKASINFSAYPTYGIKERAAGNKYLEVSGGTGFAVVLIQSGTERGFQGEDGVYTLTADVYRPDAMPITTRFSASSTEDTPIQDFTALNDAGWGSMILQHDPTCYGNGGHETVFESASEVGTIKFHRNGGTDDKTVGYDNIRLYYKPLTVNVEVTADGVKKDVEVTTLGAKASDFMAGFDLDFNKTAVGVKVNGVTYDDDDVIYLTADTTAEVIINELDKSLYDYEKGMVLYNITFEDDEVGTEIPASTKDFNVGKYATTTANAVMSHTPDNWHLNSSGLTYSVLTDPVNANNKVAGFKNGTSGGYPALMLTTYSNGSAAQYGFIENDDIVLTIEYDYYDTTADGIALRFGGKSSVSENEGFTKWTTVEDTCTESNNGRVASAWYKNYGVFSSANLSRMGSVGEISFVKMHTASPENADIYIDNVKLYYKPTTARINLNAPMGATVETATLENVSTTGMLVSELLAQAGVEYDRYMYKLSGVSFAGDSKVYAAADTISFAGDSTLNIVLEKIDNTGWVDAEKGYLLFDIDFDDASAVSVFTPEKNNKDYNLSSFGSKVNPNFAGSENWGLNNSGMDIVGIEDGALKLQWDGTGKWPQVLIGHLSNSDGGSLVGEDGYYYVHAEYKVLGAVDADLASIAIQSNGYIDGVHKGPSGIYPMGNTFYASKGELVADQWLIIDGAHTENKSTGALNDTDGIFNDDINKITTVFTYNATSASAGGYYLMDNVKLYWKPAEVKLTVYGGSNEDYETVNLTVPSTMDVDDLIAKLPEDPEYGKITGLADMDGNKIDSFSVMSNTSLIAVWSPWVILEGGQEFEEDKKGVNTTMWSANYGHDGQMGNGGADITTALRWMYSNGWYSENGNMFRVQKTPVIGDAENGSLTAPNPYSVPATLSVDGNIRDMIYTTLPANNDAEYILVKYRYDNLPDLKAVAAANTNPEGYEYTVSDDGLSLTFIDRKGETRTFKLAPDYGSKYYLYKLGGGYEYAGGEEFHQNELLVEDEWYYDFVPMTAAVKESGIQQVYVQRYNLFHEMITEYDYVRFVKLGEEEDVVLPNLGGDDEPTVKIDRPASSEEIEVRLDSEDYTRNGVRFKAAVTAAADETATDIGFVVTTETKAAAVGYDEVTVDDDFVVVGYKRLYGEEKTNYFNTENSNALEFAAVLKDIPMEQAATLLFAKPFVAVDGVYVYGTPIMTSLYDELAKLYFVNPTDPEGSDCTEWFNDLYVTDVDLALYIEDIIFYVNEW